MFSVAKSNVIVVSVLFGLFAGGDAVSSSGDDAKNASAAPGEQAYAMLKDMDGDVVGVVHVASVHGDKVIVQAAARNVEPAGAFHGFHIHETGECEPPFTSAGDHYNPDSGDHGDHAGDMPPLAVTEDGHAWTSFVTDSVSVGELFDEDGSAVMIHTDEDNFANIPERYHSHEEDVRGPDSETLSAGDAGDRFACGVVTQGDADNGEAMPDELPDELRSVLR